ncbi:anti-sigma B factor antagonist [Streptomyces canus]|uniref:STAS domain-containing protein n=1 Tax=Streptomyces canus TaxID=58343 RepID=UPI00277E88CA|nr:STAS domain-containing protein [Streptomyces canus]MDQ0595981.1 anti-sigma B factor antagonist [Streptomyces canus]
MTVPTVGTSLSGDCLLARVSGDMIYENQALLRGQFEDLLQHSARCIVLDMTQVAFCDSTGLNTLLNLRRQAEKENTVLFLACVPASLRRVVELTGTDQLLPVYDTVTDAQMAWTRKKPENKQPAR